MELSYALPCRSSIPRGQLPAALQLHILSLLPPNDRTLSGRLVSPDAADALAGPQHCTASLSQPLPPHAVPWAMEEGQKHVRQVPYWGKLQLLSSAVSSGSEVNLGVALELLQPTVFPETFQRKNVKWSALWGGYDPSEDAVKEGHIHLLGWLMRRLPALVEPVTALAAAAQCRNLAELHATRAALQGGPACFASQEIHQEVLDAAAASPTPDAMAKMEWLLTEGGGTCTLQLSTAEAAARSGDLSRLLWLQSRSCPMDSESVLVSALASADLAVVKWLVEEAGCSLPADGSSTWPPLLRAAVGGVQGVAELQWLQARGAPRLQDANIEVLQAGISAAMQNQQVETVRFLLATLPSSILACCYPAEEAAASNSIPLAEIVRQFGFLPSPSPYEFAAVKGSLACLGSDRDACVPCRLVRHCEPLALRHGSGQPGPAGGCAVDRG